MTSALSPLPSGGALPGFVLVARREILVRVRSRVFAATTVAMAVLVGGGVLASSFVNAGSSGRPPEVHVAFSGGSQALEPSFASVAAALGQSVTITYLPDPGSGRSLVQAGTLDMAVSGPATAPAALVSDGLPPLVEIALDAAAQDARLAAAGLTPAAISSVMAGVPFETVRPAGSTSPGPDQSVFAALAVAIVLFVSIAAYGNLVAQGVVEEKATRIMEILLATVRPTELLGGKILGIGCVGLLQLVIVAAAALLAGGVTHVVSIPALGPVEVACYLAWFLLGFALYAAAFATVAALISRQEEIQSATAPVTVVLGGSYILMFFALPEPTGALSTVLSMLPPSAPIFMPMRIAAAAAVPWQVVLAMVLTVVAIAGVVWLAGRIYANSAMRIGARVSFAEAFHG